MNKLQSGMLLVSDPFLKDPNFLRSVVLICEHNNEGCFGFVLNNKYEKNLNELVENLDDIHFPVYQGGPVHLNTLHFLHTKPLLITGGLHIIDNIYWGGNFNKVLELISTRQIKPKDIRFYLGYSGWSEGQLEEEVEQKSWMLHPAKRNFVFHLNTNNLWKDVLNDMGGDYKLLGNYPKDPQLN